MYQPNSNAKQIVPNALVHSSPYEMNEQNEQAFWMELSQRRSDTKRGGTPRCKLIWNYLKKGREVARTIASPTNTNHATSSTTHHELPIS
jgi:hypothetical protein